MAAALSISSSPPPGWRFVAEGAIGFGSRVRRVTREDAFERQPLDAGDIILVADARIDNRTELARALEMDVRETRPWPDSLFILESYRRWGEDCPRHLLGDFVFAIWDRRTQTLLCARDHRGGRVLFYHHSSHGFGFASAPRGVVALPHVPRQLDERVLADFLILIGDTDSSFYKGIYRLPAGSTLTSGPAGVRIDRYWSMDPERRVVLSSDEEYLEAFREIFDEAVRCRLRSAYPIGAFMSGGLDSSSVACVAARELDKVRGRLTTFTSVPARGFPSRETDHTYDDETPYVQTIRARFPNIRQVYVHGPGRSSLSGLDHLFDHFEAPVRNPSNRVWMEEIVDEARRRGIRVLLNGQEGNDWISYSGNPLLYDLASSGAWISLFREIRALANNRGCSPLSLLRRFVIAPLIPVGPWEAYRSRRAGGEPWLRHSAINPAFAARMEVRARLYDAPESPFRRPIREGRAFRVALANSGAVTWRLDCDNGWRSRFGIEFRDPTADKRVIEFCLAIPHDQHLRRGQERALARRAMEGRVPLEILRNRKRGIQAPDWFVRMTASRPAILQEIGLLEGNETARGCLDLPRMRRLAETWPRTDAQPTTIADEYMLLLDRGLTVGRFIRWFEHDRGQGDSGR